MDDCEKVWKWEEAQRRAKSLKLEIRVYVMGFQVLPTEEFMGKRTASPGEALTTGIPTLDGLLCCLEGIEAIISRKEMIQSLIRAPEEGAMAAELPLGGCREPNNVLQMGYESMREMLQALFDWLYWDDEAKAYDPDKESESGADFLGFVATEFSTRGLDPQAQSLKED